MKRRNADCGKLRRPIKRNKITESMYGSTTVLYMKFLVLWAIVITADFMFMFRFEFLWPFWLLLRSVHDSFKYKGLAFSVLFVCIAITSDLVCLFFIPVNWLLFAASTYVWVQYVWHTDKGICLPTIILWMLFVYLEAGIRWKDSRHMPHLDLCRPFAAHCIGYPVVTLGFGFKSYVGYRMRQRKQREVSKENEFYMQLLQQALPQEEPAPSEDTQTVVATNASNTTNAVAAVVAGHGSAAQNQHNHHNGNTTLATGASLTAAHTQISNSIATANGSVALTQNQQQQLQQQHHHHQHNHHQQQEQHLHSNNHNGNSFTTTTNVSSNGHIGGGSSGGGKNHRRSMDKENKHKGSSSSNHNNLAAGDNESHTKTNNKNNYHQLNQGNESNTHHQQQQQNHNNNNNKEKSSEWDNNYHQQQPKDKHESQQKSNKKSNTSTASSAYNVNGNVNSHLDTEDVVTVEPVEKTKGRRNRSKKDNASKDNHHHNNNNNNSSNSSNNNNNNNHHSHTKDSSNKENHNNTTKDTHNNHHHNSDASSVSSSSSSTSSSSSSGVSGNSATSTISHLASKVVSKICESCLKLEADVKKYRSEISHMKQIENELRQKLDTNMTTKSCLQAKQKECDELEKRLHELTNARHNDMMQLQTVERRLAEERRQKQSLDAQLNNEKKARKLAEEKAARPECSSQCKQRKQQMEEEIKQLRRDLKMAEEAKQMAEQHGRKWEQELRMFEQEIRNRDSIQPGTDVLMNALAAMQDKNCTLEKNLSAETRVKLDLFSALGDAKRQLEISESLRRSKEDEVHDLKAKIAQLLAVMPTDTLCLPACSSTGASSMLRMNDTPPLQTGPGPASPMLTSLSAAQAQQQLTGRVIVSASTSDYVQQTLSGEYVVTTHSQQQQQHQQQQQQQQHQQHQQQQQQQQQCAGVVPVSVATSVLVTCPQVSNGVGNPNGSNLDPNATVYTPKSGGPNNNGGNVVAVGGSGDA
ncbi:macoilin-2 isoform X2 [Lucilia cuprina]|uniref:macoilin-2 isoform X2 n=1 Tax=Lucilia cuprina TaxID=7375 RepID=UPI001F069CEA|nr:macoilin-2 isoform X2 [Lucilia cuprina]